MDLPSASRFHEADVFPGLVDGGVVAEVQEGPVVVDDANSAVFVPRYVHLPRLDVLEVGLG